MQTTFTTVTGAISTTYRVELGSRGPQGIQGEQGEKGDQGIQGEVGPPGPTDYNLLTNVPATFPPSAHTHVVSNITSVSGTHLIGRHAGGSGNAQEVSVGNGVEFSGSGIRRSALTGDVTASAGSNSTTIANDAVTNGKLANMATATIKGRTTAGTGDPEDLTAAQARTVIGVSPALVVSDTAPTSPADGQQWLGLSSEVLYIWSTTKNKWIVPSVRGLDADAMLWINAVIAAGGTIITSEDATRRAASDYFEALKADSNGNLLALALRLYLPIWGVAAANAICAKTRFSGTFAGTVTHNSGHVNGDGSTGYFDLGVTPVTAGASQNSMSLMALAYAASNVALASIDKFIGAHEDAVSTGHRAIIGATSASNLGVTGPNVSSTISGSAGGDFRGILIGSRTGSAARFVGRRNGAGWSSLASDTAASVGINSTRNIFALCQNSDGTAASFLRSTMGLGAYGVGLGMTAAQAEAFSLHTKNFWEAATGITMP